MRKLGLLLCVISLFMGNVFAQKRALIVIDIQNDYFKGGAMELVDLMKLQPMQKK